MSVQAILPTIAGRERALEQTVAAYKDQGAEVLVVKGAPTCGEGWQAGLEQAEADYVILGADDSVPRIELVKGPDGLPHPSAVDAGIAAANEGVFPSPRVVLATGRLESCGSLGGGGAHLGECPDGTIAYISSYPIATREAWEEMGPIPPIHYYVDDFLGYRARQIGLRCEVRRDYSFTHLEEKHGTPRMVARVWEDRVAFLETLTNSESSTRYAQMVPVG